MSNPDDSHSVNDRAVRLRELEALWERRFKYQPRLPSGALLSAAVAMACGFGAVMFFLFAWAEGWRRWLPDAIGMAILGLALGLLNRWLAKRWFEKVKRWSAERARVLDELESLRGLEDQV